MDDSDLEQLDRLIIIIYHLKEVTLLFFFNKANILI